ncbi:type II toxin-antitoxin system Phd/YefM family antitoxin [Methylobacterium sp. WSM2598]|uniref:type II toxin-antitoxin system Phd/YefM family antitoxin n=1 Tax=Methylobacterium sp. WSM2598 TaxID=398261 RepID=UPI00037DDC28|nr:type II toxin-antitoxin system Phd/YefM family antitoxin [Methylobacterium sp. WSM2598]
MATYTAKEAAARLPELLDRAAEGEEVVITRPDGEPVRLVAEDQELVAPGPVTEAEIAWLRANRVTLAEQVGFTARVREMRDEDP